MFTSDTILDLYENENHLKLSIKELLSVANLDSLKFKSFEGYVSIKDIIKIGTTNVCKINKKLRCSFETKFLIKKDDPLLFYEIHHLKNNSVISKTDKVIPIKSVEDCGSHFVYDFKIDKSHYFLDSYVIGKNSLI